MQNHNKTKHISNNKTGLAGTYPAKQDTIKLDTNSQIMADVATLKEERFPRAAKSHR